MCSTFCLTSLLSLFVIYPRVCSKKNYEWSNGQSFFIIIFVLNERNFSCSIMANRSGVSELHHVINLSKKNTKHIQNTCIVFIPPASVTNCHTFLDPHSPTERDILLLLLLLLPFYIFSLEHFDPVMMI